MKKPQLILFLGLFVASLAVTAQDFAFQVMINKGSNEVKSGAAWQPVKTGASLKTGDELKLGDNSYVGLRHATGKMMELKTSGTFKVADLASKVSGGASVLNKYTDFILSANSPEAKKNRLSATGAVHRGDREAIELYLPDNQFSGIYGTKVIVNWASKGTGPYIVELQNMFEDVLAKYETTETSYTIDLTDPKLADKDINAIMVKVASKADPKQTSAVKMIKKLSAEEEKKVKTSMGEIANDVNDQTAMNKLALAGFYEEKNLVVDAITAYQEAIMLAPDVAEFKVYYEEFLIRKGMKQAKP